LTKQDQHKFYD